MDKRSINKELQKNFGENLRKIRNLKQLTLLDVEVITGIPNGQLSNIENGKRTLELITIVKIIKGLDIEATELFPTAVLETVPLT